MPMNETIFFNVNCSQRDPEFIQMLNEIRVGKVSALTIDKLRYSSFPPPPSQLPIQYVFIKGLQPTIEDHSWHYTHHIVFEEYQCGRKKQHGTTKVRR